MIETLKNWDENLFFALNGLNAEWLDPVMFIISAKFTWIPVYLFILWYVWKKTAWKFTLLFLFTVIIGITLADQIALNLFKNVFERYRPSHNEDFGHLVHVVRDFNGNEYRGGMYGFVSNHAANFGMLASLIGLTLRRFNKKWLPVCLVVFMIVAYTRIYLGVHFPADIMVGGLLGLAIGSLLYFILIRVTPYTWYQMYVDQRLQKNQLKKVEQ